MPIKILLINPNRMREPPTIPIGLEYLKTSLVNHGYETQIIDLSFEEKPLETLELLFDSQDFDISGITIRNIDTCSFFTLKFFIPDIKKISDCIKRYKMKVILGGSGFSAMPEEILEYTGADFGVIGPGEEAILNLLEDWKRDKIKSSIYNGWKYEPREFLHYRGTDFDYSKYLGNDGVVGFETQKGCYNKCPYCIEAQKPVFHKKIENVIAEIKYITEQGYHHFHLCDSEFNLNLDYSIRFCEALIDENIDIKWALYMKPYPYNERLFKLLFESNAYLITLSVDSYEELQNLNNYSYQDLEKIIEYCKKYQIKLAIDLSCGYPGESKESIRNIIDFFKNNRPDTVGITFFYRIYNHTPLSEIVKKDEFKDKLTRKLKPNDTFLEPVFYSSYDVSFYENLIEGDDLFRIAGLKPGVNYQLD
jgi:radical SAM superfamily enzyme YgiQ (UPF0313 family)